MPIFADLQVFHDESARSAALNMAIDEALLETAKVPAIRFYRWNHPALSFGYFGRFSDVELFAPERDLVRRWTGGGIVFHGDDLTYSIVVPTNDPAFTEPAMSIYRKTHEALRCVLAAEGQNVDLARDESPRISDACFANPVRADVLLNGQKIAGAAQRRTRAGLLQQGSIQAVDLVDDFELRFAQGLSLKIQEGQIDNGIMQRAEQISLNKYGTEPWLRRR